MFWDLFLLPYTLLGWFFKYLFSAVMWFTLFAWLHYMVTENFTWRDLTIWQKFRKKSKKVEDKPEDYII
jgi:hypothetical protein